LRKGESSKKPAKTGQEGFSESRNNREFYGGGPGATERDTGCKRDPCKKNKEGGGERTEKKKP